MNEMMVPCNSLSVTLGPLVGGGGDGGSGGSGGFDVRGALRYVADSGYRFVQLSGAIAGLRPRELGRSARRDLRARLGRMGLVISGIDLWVPSEHFEDGAQCERAVNALKDVIELAADLGRVGVSTALPNGGEDGDGDVNGVMGEIADRADICGVLVTDYGDGGGEGLEMIGWGIDPAAEILKGRDPVAEVLGNAGVGGARFSDADGAGRVEQGLGRLDVLGYQVALVTAGYSGAVVVDLRGLGDAVGGVKRARALWEGGMGGGGGVEN